MGEDYRELTYVYWQFAVRPDSLDKMAHLYLDMGDYARAKQFY